MDAKLQEVLLDHGLEGYGLYWYCIELIAQKVSTDKLTFELEHDCRIIARNTGSTPAKVQNIMSHFIELGLFNANNGHVFCLKLANRCDDFTSKLVRKNGVKTLTNQELRESPTKTEKVPLDKIRLDKNRLDNNTKTNAIVSKKKNFVIPSQSETADYFLLKGSSVSEAEKFWFFYDAKNWMVGKNKMQKWKSSATGWILRNKQQNNKPQLQDLSVTLDDNSWANNIDDVL